MSKIKTVSIPVRGINSDIERFRVRPGSAGTVTLLVDDHDAVKAGDGVPLVGGLLTQDDAGDLAQALLVAAGLPALASLAKRQRDALRGKPSHEREALAKIIEVCHGTTPGDTVDDLAQCANLAGQGLDGSPLVGDPGVYDLAEVVND